MRTQLIVASIVNLLIVGILLYITMTGEDEVILIFIFGYALLLFVNIMMWATAGKSGKSLHVYYHRAWSSLPAVMVARYAKLKTCREKRSLTCVLQ